MSHCEHGEVSHPDLRFAATHRYLPHEKSSKVNKHIQREGGKQVKTGIVLHQVCLHAFPLASGALSTGIFSAAPADV